MQVKNNSIVFEIENNFDKNVLPRKTGIGIKNLRRRLELAYPKKHALLIIQSDDEHIAYDIIKGYCGLIPNMQLMRHCCDFRFIK